jgi:hypothetical protein
MLCVFIKKQYKGQKKPKNDNKPKKSKQKIMLFLKNRVTGK